MSNAIAGGCLIVGAFLSLAIGILCYLIVLGVMEAIKA